MGDDVLISGTVAAAQQGYLRGLHALAVSIEGVDSYCLDTAARLAALLSRWINANSLPGNIFLNVNARSDLTGSTDLDSLLNANRLNQFCAWIDFLGLNLAVFSLVSEKVQVYLQQVVSGGQV